MSPQFRIVPLAVACALGLPCLTFVQIATAQDDNATELDEVIVTATRTATTADAALAPVEVIDRTQIERSQATSVIDLLRGRAGINVANQGGAGKLSSVFMRGTEADHVLVLVDGIRVSSATSGLASFQDLPVALIDRIEIVRGPRSSLYGSDAIGGVIQIFTRRDRGALAPRMAATVGSHGYAEGSAGVGGGFGRSWFGIDASYQNDEGIDACRGSVSPFAGCFTVEPDRDAYRNRSLSLRGGFDASDTLHFDAHAMRAEGRNEYDGDFVNLSKVVQQVLGGKVQWQPSQRVNLQFVFGRNTDASDNFLHNADGERDEGYFDTDRDSATLQGDFAVGKEQLLTFGLDWLHDRVESDTDYSETERDNEAVFAQYQGKFGAHSIQASLRHDDNEQFGSHVTGGAAWGFDFARRWRVTAGYGTAFKAPTFVDLYFPPFGPFPTSNPDLRPEESKTWEAGVAYRGDRFNWRLDAYSTQIDDLISLDELFIPQNLEHARIRGAELGFDTRFAQWTLDASASFVDAENREGVDAGNDLPRRARQTARIELDRNFGRFRLGFTGIGGGARYDNVANTRRLGGFATLDVRAEYAFTPSWSLQARVANVFDQQYETAAFYNQPGREYRVSLRYAPVR
jgi:vitamin B12 transporter